jgi:hypothetical protein
MPRFGKADIKRVACPDASGSYQLRIAARTVYVEGLSTTLHATGSPNVVQYLVTVVSHPNGDDNVIATVDAEQLAKLIAKDLEGQP